MKNLSYVLSLFTSVGCSDELIMSQQILASVETYRGDKRSGGDVERGRADYFRLARFLQRISSS